MYLHTYIHTYARNHPSIDQERTPCRRCQWLILLFRPFFLPFVLPFFLSSFLPLARSNMTTRSPKSEANVAAGAKAMS